MRLAEGGNFYAMGLGIALERDGVLFGFEDGKAARFCAGSAASALSMLSVSWITSLVESREKSNCERMTWS